MSMVARFSLGAAGLSLPDYPPGSGHPRPSPDEVVAIVSRAYDLGVRHFDCARAYAQAEDVLAKALGLPLPADVFVTSKSAPEYYLQAYTVSPFRPMLLHNPTVEQLWLWWHDAAGASVNTPEQASVAIAAGYKHLQFPHWVLDQRYEKAGIFEAAKANGVTTYARQPFGRGLLLATPRRVLELEARGAAPWYANQVVAQCQAICDTCGISYVEAGLRFSLESKADLVVFGVSSMAQLEEDLTIASTDPPASWPACYADLLSTFADAGVTLASVCTPEAK